MQRIGSIEYTRWQKQFSIIKHKKRPIYMRVLNHREIASCSQGWAACYARVGLLNIQLPATRIISQQQRASKMNVFGGTAECRYEKVPIFPRPEESQAVISVLDIDTNYYNTSSTSSTRKFPLDGSKI